MVLINEIPSTDLFKNYDAIVAINFFVVAAISFNLSKLKDLDAKSKFNFFLESEAIY